MKLPIWLVVALAIAAGAFQLADNLTAVDFPGVGLWAIGLIALAWVILPTVIALAPWDATLWVGWLLGVVSAVTLPL